MIVRRAIVQGYNCLYFSDFLSAEHLTLKHIVALEAAALGWITIPPPPKLSPEAKTLMASYSDEDKLNRLLLGGDRNYGWDGRYVNLHSLLVPISTMFRFGNMIRLRKALRVAAANPLPPSNDGDAGTMNTPTQQRELPAV